MKQRRQFASNLYRHKLRALIGLAFVGMGIYLIILLLAPAVRSRTINRSPIGSSTIAENQELRERNNELVISKIGVDLEFKAGDASVLDDFVWWRHSDRGNPVDGGNFILSAHRFKIGLTPTSTIRQSPFYNIDKLVIGDDIIVYYEGEKYEYEIVKKYGVAPDAIEIEAPSKDAKLTLYSCTFKGASDGRDVIEAKLKET